MSNYSDEHKEFLRKIKIRNITLHLISFLIIIICIVIWQILADNNYINTFLFSSPYKIFTTTYNLLVKENLIKHIGITFFEVLISFIISGVVGILIASIMWWNKTIQKIIDPYITVLNSLPKVALGPLIIIWFGASIKSIVFMSLLISIFIIIINTYQNFITTDNNLIIMARSFGASKWQIFKYIVFPSNYNNIISTFKISISMNLIGVIMGELLVSKKGLGYLIMYGSQVFNIDLVISCVFILGVISFLMYYLLNKIK